MVLRQPRPWLQWLSSWRRWSKVVARTAEVTDAATKALGTAVAAKVVVMAAEALALLRGRIHLGNACSGRSPGPWPRFSSQQPQQPRQAVKILVAVAEVFVAVANVLTAQAGLSAEAGQGLGCDRGGHGHVGASGGQAIGQA